MEKEIKDSDILRNVLNALNFKIKEFCAKIDYGQTIIYKVLNGNAVISKELVNRIQIHFPNVSYLYLTRGKGEPLIEGAAVRSQKNTLYKREEQPSSLESFLTMPEQINYLVKSIKELKTEIEEIKTLLKQKV